VSPDAWNNKDFNGWTTSPSVNGQLDDAMTNLNTGFTKYEGSLDGN